MYLISKFNDFLNLFERFFKRFVAVLIILTVVPFCCLAYLFGFFSIKTEIEENE